MISSSDERRLFDYQETYFLGCCSMKSRAPSSSFPNTPCLAKRRHDASFLQTVDQLLRGSFTRPEDLREGRVTITVRVLLVAGLILGALYGVFMGLYGVLRPETPSAWQLVATTAKVPLLFLLTLIVTYPSLYVFSTLSGSPLKFMETLRLLLIGIAVNLSLLSSFGPITGFFTLCTESYPFMCVLNVLFFSVGGIAGLVLMYKCLNSVMDNKDEANGLPNIRAKRVFYAWSVIFGAVGAQMGWILRPFVGAPGLPFEIFRERESHFFEALFKALGELMG